MPYVSEKQRAYLHARHPELAERWDKKYGGKIVPKKKKRKKKGKLKAKRKEGSHG